MRLELQEELPILRASMTVQRLMAALLRKHQDGELTQQETEEMLTAPHKIKSCNWILMENRGFEPLIQPSGSIDTDITEPVQIHTNSQQINALTNSASSVEKQIRTSHEHPNDTSLHGESVTCVHHIELVVPDDLREVIEAWGHLPEAVKTGIMAMVRVTQRV